MSLRLAAPTRQHFHPAWMAVPLLLAVIACCALVFVALLQPAPLHVDAPAGLASLPAAA
jgi:hypothetical protein